MSTLHMITLKYVSAMAYVILNKEPQIQIGRRNAVFSLLEHRHVLYPLLQYIKCLSNIQQVSMLYEIK